MPAIATRQEPSRGKSFTLIDCKFFHCAFSEQAITPLTLISTLTCWTCQAAGAFTIFSFQEHFVNSEYSGTSSQVQPPPPQPCATRPASTRCTIPTTITSSPSTPPTLSPLPTYTPTTHPHSNGLLSTPLEPFPIHTTLALCLATTLPEGLTSQQPSSRSSSSGLAMSHSRDVLEHLGLVSNLPAIPRHLRSLSATTGTRSTTALDPGPALTAAAVST